MTVFVCVYEWIWAILCMGGKVKSAMWRRKKTHLYTHTHTPLFMFSEELQTHITLTQPFPLGQRKKEERKGKEGEKSIPLTASAAVANCWTQWNSTQICCPPWKSDRDARCQCSAHQEHFAFIFKAAEVEKEKKNAVYHRLRGTRWESGWFIKNLKEWWEDRQTERKK